MAIYGLDQVRGGCFDVVERQTQAGLPMEFTWGNTKDFWQQEQGILAYLILHGATGEGRYLTLAREMAAFWNIFFLDHDNRGIFFRVTAEGQARHRGRLRLKRQPRRGRVPQLRAELSGAHLHPLLTWRAGSRMTTTSACFSVRIRNRGRTTLNVLPDFYAPGTVEITGINVNGIPRTSFSPDNFQVELD